MNTTVIRGDWVELDGGPRAWLALPAGVNKPPGVLLYIEAFGVNDHMRRVAERYAEAGYAAIVPDIFHGKIIEYGNMESAIAAIKELDDDQAMAESARALDALSAAGVQTPPATVGFCMGGRLAFLAGAALGQRLSAAVCYYGGAIAPGTDKDKFGRRAPIVRADELAVPTLLHYGGKDRSIGPEEHARVATALSATGKRYTISVYPEAGHAFACDDRANYHAASAAEAWALTRQFLALHGDS